MKGSFLNSTQVPARGSAPETRSGRLERAERFARRVFLGAGVYGLLVLLPQYVVDEVVGAHARASLQAPEHFLGFVGVGVAWQLAFLVISRDVLRYRLLMLPALAEKLLFGVPALTLFAQGRLHPHAAGAAVIDLFLALLFTVSFVRLRAGARPVPR